MGSGGFLAAGGTWNTDDVILFSTGPIVRISAHGGTPEPVTIVDRARKEIGHSLPVFLPDGRHFLYLRASPSTDGSGIYIGSLETRPEAQDARRVIATRAGALYVPGGEAGPGRLLFLRGSLVFAQPFDAAALRLEGEAVPVLERVGSNGGPATRYGLVSASPAGVLAYREPETVYATPVWVDCGGRELGALVPEPLDSPANLRLSPDGRRLALTRDGNVWIYDSAGRPPVKLTTDGLADMLLWTTDGARVVFEHGGPPQRLLSVAADAAGDAPRVVSPPGHYHAHGWSPDKRHLIAVINTYSPTGWDIVTLPVGLDAPPQPVLQTRFNEGSAGASLSPDGRWLAYPSNATGALEIWVQPYPGPGTPRRISPNGGTDPAWSKDGRELFYLEGRNMMAVGVQTGSTFDFAKPVQLFASPYLHQRFTPLSYDVAADRRFIMLKQANTMSTPTPFTVVLNWRAGH